MAVLHRRTFLKGAVGAGVLGGPFQGLFAWTATHAAASSHHSPASYGPLQPVPDLRDDVVRLHLPAGFEYRSFDVTGQQLTDGTPIPGRHDGMAALPGPDGLTTLVRNHEVNGPVGAFGDPATAYDRAAGGGTTTVLVDHFGNVRSSHVSLNGTMMNCAGGPMPWGSWLSCEETVNGPDVGPDFTGMSNEPLRKPHGYVFEVPADGGSISEPIRMAGRFAHEAAAYDPRSGAVYLTEDNFAFPSGFYRYLPPVDPMRIGRLVDGGRLQMLKVTGWPNADLAGEDGAAPTVGIVYDVEWVDIDDPDPRFRGPQQTTNDQALTAVGGQGFAQGAARFSRLEGCVADNGTVYFCSTQGGARPPGAAEPSGYGHGRGQIWAYHSPSQTLRLVYESPSRAVLDLPDNVTVSATGALLLCEDGDEGNWLRGLTTDGRLFDFAMNAIPGRTDDEFAGAGFSPDFHTLYVNIQASTGMTFAIWGPWQRGGFGTG